MRPLAPLSVEEVVAAAGACRCTAQQKGISNLRFNTITLQEPAKADYLRWRSGAGPCPPRRAFCILQTPPAFVVIEAVVELPAATSSSSSNSGSRVVSWQELDGAQLQGQPLATPDDCLQAEAIARADPQVQQLLAERGITDPAQLACDPWAIHACPEEWQGRRLMQVFTYFKEGPDDNEYAHPLDVCPVVDLYTEQVIHIDAYPTPPLVPRKPGNYHRDLLSKPPRPAPQPLHVVQPQGPSYSVDGWHVSWQNWDLHLGFNGREGLVLYDVAYTDPDQGGRRRPVLHRGSIVEMAVPYADPRTPYNRKCAFDAGDYGLGFAANSLKLGCDCLGVVAYFDGVVNNAQGEAVVIENAVCLHEEDHGLLWKHLDYRTGYAETRRSRRLVISFVMTAVNYEYLFYWYLYQDGTIGHEIKLTGILSTSVLSPGEAAPTHGTMVAPLVNAAAHQHLFSARLDMAVDDDEGGRQLVVSEVDAEQQPTDPASNPTGNAFFFKERDLLRVSEAQRMAAPEVNRVWRIKNPGAINPYSGSPVSYHLMPAAGPILLAQRDSPVARRGVFTTRSLWVTPHVDGQVYPAGQYVFQSRRDTGLAEWTREDVPLAGADPVLWYTFGLTHQVRMEDYPVMPVDSVSFMLKPFGFFTWNPSLDLPPEVDPASKRHHPAAAGAGVATACCAASPAGQQQQPQAGCCQVGGGYNSSNTATARSAGPVSKL